MKKMRRRYDRKFKISVVACSHAGLLGHPRSAGMRATPAALLLAGLTWAPGNMLDSWPSALRAGPRRAAFIRAAKLNPYCPPHELASGHAGGRGSGQPARPE
jgi:hypothetical protein